jgi:hypothetical protein
MYHAGPNINLLEVISHSLFPEARADFSDPTARWQRGRKLPILYFRVKSACRAV